MSIAEAPREVMEPASIEVNGTKFLFVRRVGVTPGMTDRQMTLAQNVEAAFVMMNHRLGVAEPFSAERPYEAPHAFYRHPDVPEEGINGIMDSLAQIHPEYYGDTAEVQAITSGVCMAAVEKAMEMHNIVPPIKTILG